MDDKENVINITENMIAVPPFSELLRILAEQRNHCIISATRRGFSSCQTHEESEFNDYLIDNDHLKRLLEPKFYANGDCEGNEGYVSILFEGNCNSSLLNFHLCIEINFTVAVIDAAGSKRFRQSLSHVYDANSLCDFQGNVQKIGLERYLKRETLCNEPEELLPDDRLTVYLELDFSVQFENFDPLFAKLRYSYVENESQYLHLDSACGRELREVSDFFKLASDTPMKESETRLVCLSPDEMVICLQVYSILIGAKELYFYSMSEICALYTVADKFCIHSMVEVSRQMMKSFLCNINDHLMMEDVVKNIPNVLRLADKHGDESLREMISTYLETKKKFETKETKEFVHAFEEHMKEKLETDWICKPVKFGIRNFYSLSRMRDIVREPGMEFYR